MANPYLYSYILSQIFGVYLVIIAIIFASRADYYKSIINNINPNSFGVILGGASGLLLGIFLVTIHSIRGKFALDLLSVFFWFILIKSIFVLSFPEQVIAFNKKICSGNGYYVAVVIWALLGILLMANGYYLYM
jgi:hypothetical protein